MGDVETKIEERHTSVDLAKIEAGVRLILEGIGEDPDRPGLLGTPRRVALMYEEICAGLHEDARKLLHVIPAETHDEMVIVKDIPLFSVCEHHLLPFVGVAHIAYIPNQSIVGLSKMARIVEFYARRPQLQERLTEQIAGFMAEKLTPQGVMVVIEARHLCVEMRGVKKPGALTVTSAIRGIFNTKPVREEFLDLLNRRG